MSQQIVRLYNANDSATDIMAMEIVFGQYKRTFKYNGIDYFRARF